ncbi:DNA topoisomerase family protein [Alteromonas sp. ASW11-130]|uniref:DNA topoisomerase family protein n=1 Tax=Alteromonas sp. ASW11-130 TaxID=3015775 RepID=UPI0022419B9F|nr:topoisomerase DNA-binding C4 zinc finger domain-containing protein [Alteromonas sp. ASW11-130]MCW8093474.1 topoisomerase DNA-binding C4 zinc finger domain-containing protein [Alteromonas sp. ASW11-130]
MSKIDLSLFSAEEHALDDSLGPCPECGRALHIRNSKTGPFVGCSGFPDCHFSKPIHDNQTTTLTAIDGSVCPSCGEGLAVKKGRYGMFVGCSGFPVCQHIAPLKQKQETELACPQCHDGKITERTNKYGKRFYSCDRYPKCRYVVNWPPVAGTCPDCGWSMLIDKKGTVCCPQPKCDFKQS